MPIPKTWKELLNIAKYIKKEENKIGNDIMAYNGLFNRMFQT